MSDYELYKKAIKELERNKYTVEAEIRAKQRELEKINKLKMLLAYKIGGGEVEEKMVKDILGEY